MIDPEAQEWLRRTSWPDLPAGAPRRPPQRGETWVQLPSGIVVPEAAAPRPRPLALDLFCGCGGFSIGLIQAGFAVVGAADADADATITYMYNLGSYPAQFHFVEPDDEAKLERALLRESKRKRKGKPVGMPTTGGARDGRDMAHGYKGVGHFFFGDLSKVSGADILSALHLGRGDLDLVVGGPPCQGFSAAGKREVLDPRNSLVFEFVRLVTELAPKSMVMENVPGMASMVTPDGHSVVDELCRIIEAGDFTSYEAARQVLSENPGARRISRRTRQERAKRQPEHAPQMGLFGEVP